MTTIVTYGLGGYCENCDETHNHPPHNLIEIIETNDQPDLTLDPA